MSVNTNDLLQAIDIVAESRVKKYQYDETVEAKIISTNRRSEGIYKVEYQNGKFDAYTSDSQTYYENEVVYVMVPKGDYTKQKYIIGRKVDEQTENATYSFNFKLPFDNFVGLENLTYGETFETKGYLANHPYHGVYTNDTDTNMTPFNKIWHWERVDDNPVIETKMGIAADWRSLLGKYRPRRGVFGLRIDVTGMTKPVEGENSKLKTNIYYFTNDDMYGNTYAFYEPSQQQIILDISDYLTLNTIDIWFYQDRHFIDQYNRDIPYQSQLNEDPNANNLPANLVLTGLQVLLGLTIDECKTDRVFLYTYDDMYYGYDPLRQLANGTEESQVYLQTYSEYHDQYIAIQVSSDTVENKEARLQALVKQYEDEPGFEWIKMTRTLHFAWVHLDDGNPVLVNHYKKLSENDAGAFEYWEEKVDAQLHWYHYELNCAQNYDVLAERQGGVNWKYLGSTPEQPDSQADIDVNTLNAQLEAFNDYVVTPDTTRARDQWKAIVSVHNVPYTTEPLIFTNVDSTIETDGEVLNEVTLRFLREEIVNEKQHLIDKYNRLVINGTLEEKQELAEELGFETWVDNAIADKITSLQTDEFKGVVNIVEDTTLRDFYVYDENNRVLKDKDNFSYADRWYYVQIWIRNNDNGEYLPMTYEPGDNAYKLSVEWDWEKLDKIPGNSMIESWAIPTQEELQNSVLAPTLAGASDVYNNQIINITRKFKIRDYLDLAYLNNTIGAVVYRHNKVYHPQIELHFGQSGSMGSAYTVQIMQTEPQGQYLVQDEQFTLTAAVIEKGKTVAESANQKYIFSWQCLSPTIITKSSNEGTLNEDNTEKQEWEVVPQGALGFIGNQITGYIRNDNPPIFKVSVLNAANYTISATIGFRLISNKRAASIYTTNCPTKVEFKSDGTVPLTLMSEFSVFKLEDNELNEVYPEWDLTQAYHAYDGWHYNVHDYLALEPQSYFDTQIATNTNPLIEYQMQTENSEEIDLDANFAPGTLNSQHATAYLNLQRLIIEAYDRGIAALDGTESDIVERKTALTITKETRLKNLDIAAAKIIPATTVYRLDPYIRNTTTTSGWYWEDSMSNYYTCLTWSMEDDNGNTIVFKQAIPFTRNVYSSSLLNTWDGQLMIDEAENAVLAQMISAGVKNSNNTFTGVVMGDWSEKADSSLDIPGLYGLKDGAQVFGFRVNGTGFIGKSGRGQIQFDGNHSLISNADKTMYLNLDPASYDYDINNLTFKTYKSYSPYFLYAETRSSSPIMFIGEDQLEFSTIWAEKFMKDVSKDYFIVDPNNGILTTGGIIARYGKIGNWMISSAGLYQKYSGNTRLTSRYMYLGYPTINLESLETEYKTKLNNLENQKNSQLSALLNRYNNNLTDEYYIERAKIIETYDNLVADVKNLWQNKITEMITNDKDQYMIFASYQPEDENPLFTVNWRGQMTARAGRIGLTSPWYITDNGLTQKNSSGIIFLGNPDASSQITDWVDDSSDIANNKFFDKLALLPNDKNENSNYAGPKVLGASDTKATCGGFAIYAGGAAFVTAYDSTLNKITRTWDSQEKIRFGIRMDGTVYATQGQIGGWTLTKDMLYAYDPEEPTNPNKLLVLDSANGIINLGNAIILSRDGKAVIGKWVDGQGTVGEIYIAGFQFLGQTYEALSFPGLPTYTAVASTTNITDNDTAYWGGSVTWAAISQTSSSLSTSTTVQNLTSVNGLLNITKQGGNSAGVTLAIGTLNSQEVAIFYPTSITGSVLGTEGHRWNIISDYITCNTLDINQGNLSAKNVFMDGKLCATQAWVYEKLNAVYSAIRAQVNSAASGVSARALAGLKAAVAAEKAVETSHLTSISSKTYITSALSYKITGSVGTLDYTLTTFTYELKDTTLDETKGSTTYQDTQGSLTLTGTDVLSVTDDSKKLLLNAGILQYSIDHGGTTIKTFVENTFMYDFELKMDTTANSTKLQYGKKLLKNNMNSSGTGFGGISAGTVSTWNEVDLKHSHQPTISWDDSSGKLKITIGNANFQKTSLTTDDDQSTLTITDTSWFKKRSIKTVKSGSTTLLTIGLTATPKKNTWSTTAISGTFNTSTKKITVPLSIESQNNEALAGDNIIVDGTDAYNEGWKAAAAEFTRSGNTVYGPSTTPGGVRQRMTVYVVDHHYARVTYHYASSDMTISKGSIVYDGAELAGDPPEINWY